MKSSKNLENLEKICGSGFGQNFLEEVGRICVDILKKGYRADSTPTTRATYDWRMTERAKLDSNDLKTYIAYTLLEQRELVRGPYTSFCSRKEYTITKTGKDVVNKHFREKGESFGTLDKIHQFVEKYEKGSDQNEN